MVKTKIISTLGPASNTETIIRKMVIAGMDVARLNFSHGNHFTHLQLINLVRKINKKYRRHIRILQDLEGHRIRIGKLKDGKAIKLKKRETIYFTCENIVGQDKLISFDYEGDLKDLKGSEFIYIDDGRLILKVKKIEKRKIKTEVVVGGDLKENKGINLPGAHLKFDNVTLKDQKDIYFGITNNVDYIAQSFVRNKKDILKIKTLIKSKLPHCLIIAKIENRQGLSNIDEIIDVSDGIMIARGDLGISVPIYKIPVIQKNIIRKCNQRKKIVITATQMLEHMVDNPWPTRAEVTDVANAILDGSNFVMLSAETASGRYPFETVKMMNQIINFTEKNYVKKQQKKRKKIIHYLKT